MLVSDFRKGNYEWVQRHLDEVKFRSLGMDGEQDLEKECETRMDHV